MIEFYETTMDLDTKKKTDLEGILFGKEDCPPSHGYGPTFRTYHLFHFVTKGHGILRIDGQVLDIGPGDAFLIPAEQVSYYEASAQNPWSYYWAGFTGFRSSAYVQNFLTINPERYVARGLSIDKYAAAIERVASLEITNNETYFRTKAVLYDIFSYLSADLLRGRTIDNSPSLASRIKFYIDAKFMEKLRMDEIADMFGIHPNHLSRVFHSSFGISPKQYLLKLKMDKAAQILVSTEMPVALIAEALGFEDQHVFSRAFKKYWEVSPMLYRKEQGIWQQTPDCCEPKKKR